MALLGLPDEILAVFRAFRTCEFATLAKDGTPIAWPTLPFFDADQGQFVVTTSIALAQKALNIRRDGRVSLLFSEPRASGLANPAAVLVQGDAVAPDEVVTTIKGYEEGLAMVFQRQPASALYSSNPLMRAMSDWYYMRLIMTVTPRRIFWWPGGDFSHAPLRIDLAPAAGAPPARRSASAAPAAASADDWPVLLRQLARFPSAVISGRDAQGYPFSARCRPTPDAASHTLRVMLPPEAPIEPGPAGLLCHSHDDLLWKQESFGLRGALQRADDGWRLEPLAIIPGISPDVLSLGRFFIDSRRKAKAYLAKRNLPRPTIPWDDIIAVKKQALSQ
ncbi:pyridoxamine 5'-phosphate oxidase family protein [Kouleothrix sp.]|uniref:pyridoxamine 5'-phosphate oxidase family protein n=1 Tax=Kouleothrix sp. TaxID=2779161 RepID=UPI00391B1F82